MEIISEIAWRVGLLYAAAYMVAGMKSAIFDGGPGPLQLIGMLWRGEIKRPGA